MVGLNPGRINSNPPYVIAALRDSICFRFVMDLDVIYYVSLLEGELMLSDESYQFTIVNTSNRKSPRNSKSRRAIVAAVYGSFECSNITLLCTCETGGSKRNMRSRLFKFWFHSSSRRSGLAFISTGIRGTDGIQDYVAIIIRLDSPNLKFIAAESTETIQVPSQKLK